MFLISPDSSCLSLTTVIRSHMWAVSLMGYVNTTNEPSGSDNG